MSAADVVQTVVTEITKAVVKLIGQELDYLLRPNKYVRELNHLIQPLKDNHKILRDAVEKALKLGKQIKPEVLRWLESAGEIIAREEELLFKDSNKRCFHGWCVDLGSRYNVNKEAVEISERITKVLPPAPESTSVALPPPPPTVVSDPDFMEFESTRETMQQIMEALKDAKSGVVGVFGMGGIGKTTIVKKIAEKIKQDKQFNQVAMAVVSKTPNLKEIQGEIASMLDLQLNQQADVLGRASQLRERLMNLKSILVILDDVWEGFDLIKIGIPDFHEHNGCKVMLTTRREDVCTSMGKGNEKKIKVGVLSKEESWELYKINAGDGIEASPLKEVAAKVMNECQCLPLALKTVGRALRDKDVSEWRSAKLQLSKAIATNIEGMTKEVISCLRLSYDYLEREEAKELFLTCCLFPEDFGIPIENLVRYAVGKGLFPYANTIDEARTLTTTTLRKLKASCLLLEGHNVDYQREECVKVHDVVRDVGVSIAREVKLLSKSGPGLGQWLQRNSIKHVKGASFITEKGVSLPQGIQCPELENLCLFAENVDYSDAFFETMKELKVLIHYGPSRLPTSLKCSVSLRILHLVRCELGDISAALGELKMIEILSIDRTDIESLPMEVGQLTSLRLLDLTENRYLKRIPGNVISQLTQLEELYIERFDDWEREEGTSGDVEKGGRASLVELQSLPFLAILSVGVRDFAQIPPKFYLPNKLVKFDIRVGRTLKHPERYPTSRVMTLGKAEFKLEGVKSLLRRTGDEGHEESSKYQFPAGATENGNGSKYVLTDLAGGDWLNGLDSLTIEDNDWISSLTSCATSRTDDDDKVVPIFSNLQELRFRSVWSLRGLASGGIGTATGGVLPNGSLQHLKVLHISGCDGLEGWVVPFSWAHRLHNLEEVRISSCGNVKGLFKVEEEKENNSTRLLLLSNLRVIKLNTLRQLRSLTNGESSSINFSNLRVVGIFKCESLVSVFTSNVVSQGLVHLETLRISHCPGLKMIFEEGVTNSSSSSEEASSSSSITFRNLKIVSVQMCKQLKSLFTVSMAKGLPKLEELYVDDNSRLTEIVSCNTNRAAGAAEENMKIIEAESSSITWPQIKRISIQISRQFKRFCPGNCFIDMPLLQDFYHTSSSDWMKNFAADPPAHGLKIPQSAIIIMTEETHYSEIDEDEDSDTEEEEELGGTGRL